MQQYFRWVFILANIGEEGESALSCFGWENLDRGFSDYRRLRFFRKVLHGLQSMCNLKQPMGLVS